MFDIQPLNTASSSAIQKKIDGKTKPLGALGQMEDLALQIALIQQSETLTVQKPTLLVFAADHGISDHGISNGFSEVTTQMVANFLAGGAAINCFCRSCDMDMKVIDAGIRKELPDSPDLIRQRLGHGTADFSKEPAMSIETAEKGIALGAKQVAILAEEGSNIVGFGEMGIGNTSASAAILGALYSLPAEECVGRGAGINDAQLVVKRQLVGTALNLHKERFTSPMNILAAVGGFEIAQIMGGMLKAAEQKMLVLIDGFIATAAALLVVRMHPEARDYMIFTHHSKEKAHNLMLEELNADPILNLDLRLGEGTGVPLALPIIRATCAFYNDMASIEEAGVSI